MKPFKSFNEFVNENYGAGRFGRINEEVSNLGEDYVFKFDEETPGAGQTAKFFMKAKLRVGENDTPEQAADKIAKYVLKELSQKPNFVAALRNPETIAVLSASRDVYKTGMDRVILKGYITFEKIVNEKGAPFKGLDAKTIAQMPGFKPLGVGPELQVPNGPKIYNAELIERASNGQWKPEKAPPADPVEPTTSSTTTTTTIPGSTSADASLNWDWKKDTLSMPSQVLEFLKGKLLANDAAKAKRGSKNRETKFAQLIILEPAFSKEKYPASSDVKNTLGAADGNYGPNTANAFGMIFDSKKDSAHDEVSSADVEDLAKFCTKLDILVPKTSNSVGLEELWKRSELAGGGGGGGGGSTSGTAGTAGTSGESGLPFVYVN